jgi:hypothetical protein
VGSAVFGVGRDGFTESCANPDEVVSCFSSGVDSPFGDFEADYGEVSEARR